MKFYSNSRSPSLCVVFCRRLSGGNNECHINVASLGFGVCLTCAGNGTRQSARRMEKNCAPISWAFCARNEVAAWFFVAFEIHKMYLLFSLDCPFDCKSNSWSYHWWRHTYMPGCSIVSSPYAGDCVGSTTSECVPACLNLSPWLSMTRESLTNIYKYTSEEARAHSADGYILYSTNFHKSNAIKRQINQEN